MNILQKLDVQTTIASPEIRVDSNQLINLYQISCNLLSETRSKVEQDDDRLDFLEKFVLTRLACAIEVRKLEKDEGDVPHSRFIEERVNALNLLQTNVEFDIPQNGLDFQNLWNKFFEIRSPTKEIVSELLNPLNLIYKKRKQNPNKTN